MNTYTFPQLKSKADYNAWLRQVKENNGMEGVVDQTWDILRKVIPVLVDEPDKTTRPHRSWTGSSS